MNARVNPTQMDIKEIDVLSITVSCKLKIHIIVIKIYQKFIKRAKAHIHNEDEDEMYLRYHHPM